MNVVVAILLDKFVAAMKQIAEEDAQEELRKKAARASRRMSRRQATHAYDTTSPKGLGGLDVGISPDSSVALSPWQCSSPCESEAVTAVPMNVKALKAALDS